MLDAARFKLRRFVQSCVRQELERERKLGGDIRREDPRTGPCVQVAQRHLFNYWRHLIESGRPLRLSDSGFSIFSQFEEDGLLLFLFAALGTENQMFVDIGAGDGINSNCANLALNFAWHGLFVDGDERNMARGREYYARHRSTWAFPPGFAHARVTRENINHVISGAGFEGPIDLLSIDIDGNDYWIWDALECVTPNVVIIETHVEFGLRSIVVPYDADHIYPGKHEDYCGASPTAMVKLARRKGYRLVGANNYGFNTIYVRNGLGEDVVPEVRVESVLRHPRNAERAKLFEDIKDWDYVQV